MIVRDGRRKYFSENTNYGVSFVTTDYFITMNADCMITKFSPNWMQDFENHRDPRYGILAATPCMEDHGHPPAEDGIENKRVGPLAWYIKTALWKEMGGLRFDGKFIHWHSDVEFMDRIEKAGLGVGLLCIYIQHEGGKSIPHELWHTHDGG